MSGPLSLIPPSVRNAATKVVAKDGGATVTVSLLTIAGIAYGAYTLGVKQGEDSGKRELAITQMILDQRNKDLREIRNELKALNVKLDQLK